MNTQAKVTPSGLSSLRAAGMQGGASRQTAMQMHDLNQSYESSQLMMYEPLLQQTSVVSADQQASMAGRGGILTSAIPGAAFSFQDEQRHVGGQQTRDFDKEQPGQVQMVQGSRILAVPYYQQPQFRAGYGVQAHAGTAGQQHEIASHQFASNPYQLTHDVPHQLPHGLTNLILPSPGSSVNQSSALLPTHAATIVSGQHQVAAPSNPFQTVGGVAGHQLNMEAIQQTIGHKSTIESHPSYQQRTSAGKENVATSGLSKGSRHGSRETNKQQKRERSRSSNADNKKGTKKMKQESSHHEAPRRPSKENRRLQSPEPSEQFVCSVQFNEVYVWGDNQFGQLGLGTVQKAPFDPQAVATASGSESSSRANAFQEQEGHILLPKICCFNTVITKVSCGMSHTLLLSSSGHVYSMGSNQFGQLGLDAPLEEDKQPAKKLLPCLLEKLQDQTIIDIQAGADHSMALNERGDKLLSWGQGKFGALGLSRSQNMRVPVEVEIPLGSKITAIAAGARHSAFITDEKKLYMFGLGTHGQLGLGEECTDRAFKPELVDLGPKHQVDQVALGDTHSLILTSRGKLMSTGANDKYQLGISPEKRGLKLFSFTKIKQFKTGDQASKMLSHKEITFKKVFTWNLNAAIDDEDRVYLWGILHDKRVKLSLCIKVPERVNSFTVDNVAIGPTMALLVDKETQQPCVIGVNAMGELGLGDVDQRKTFCILNELKEKKIKIAGIGKSGFVIALADQVIDPEDQLFSPGQTAPSGTVDRREMQMIAEQSNGSRLNSAADGGGLLNQPLNTVEAGSLSGYGVPNSSPVPLMAAQMANTSQQQIQDIQNQVNHLASMSHLNMRIQFLEGQVHKKQSIINESERRHASLMEKIEKMEAKLGSLDKADQLEREIQGLKAQLESQKDELLAKKKERDKERAEQPEGGKDKDRKRRASSGGRSKSRDRSRSGERKEKLDNYEAKEWQATADGHKKVEKEDERQKNEYNPIRRRQYVQSQFEKEKDGNYVAKAPATTRSESYQLAPKIVPDFNKEIDLISQPQAAAGADFAGSRQRSDVHSRRQLPLKAWEAGRIREGLESQYAREQIERGDPNYRSEIHRGPDSLNARGSEMAPLLREKSDPRATEPRCDSGDPTVLSRHSRVTRGSSLPRREHLLEHSSALSNQSRPRIDPAAPQNNRSTSIERRNGAQIKSNASPIPLASLAASTPALEHHRVVNQLSIAPPQKGILVSNQSGQSLRQGDLAQPQANRERHEEKLAEAESALYRLKVDFARRDTEAKEAEERIKSMTQKLDSLVKFLEEERCLRKKVQGELEEKEKEIVQLALDQAKAKEGQDRSGEELKLLESKMNSLKEDNDRLRHEKSQTIEEKQELEHKVIDLESRLRTANKQLAEKEKEFERQLQEKYDAQNKQFLLQQEMSHHTAQQLQFMASAHHNQVDAQRKIVERKEQPTKAPLNAPSSQDQFVQLSQSQQLVRDYSSNSRQEVRSNLHSSLEGRRPGPSAERLLATDKTVNKRSVSHSQDHWSASLRNQATPHLANSVPQFISATPAAMISQTKPESRAVLYSYQQYQDRNYDFIHKRIGTGDEERGPAELPESTTKAQSRKGSLDSKSKIASSGLLLGHREDGQMTRAGLDYMMASASGGIAATSIKQESRQSAWSHVKPADPLKMNLSREMSLEKHHRGTTPTPPENRNLSYISRFGQELKPTSIQEKLENLQRGYRELTNGGKGAATSSGIRTGNVLDARSRSGDGLTTHLAASNPAMISAKAADSVPACSNYMKSLQTAQQKEYERYQPVAPILSLSDSQPMRTGQYQPIPSALRADLLGRENRESKYKVDSPRQKYALQSLRPVSISASERQTETQAPSSSNNPSSAVNRNVTAAHAPTSFRSRIESLLPDHLRDQYHEQQQQFQARRQSRERGLLDAPYERRLGQEASGMDEDVGAGVRDLDYYLRRS